MVWRRGWLAVALLALLAASAALVQVVLGSEFVGKGRVDDGAFAIATLAQFKAELARGAFPPRWSFTGFGGLGSPIFYFYPPGAYAIAAVIAAIAPGLALSQVLALGKALSLVAAAVFAAAWVRRLAGRGEAALAGLFYVLAPYIGLLNPVRRFAFAEIVAEPLWPLAFLAVAAAGDDPVRLAVFLAPVVAAFSLVHIPSWILCVGIAPLYALAGASGPRSAARRALGAGAAVVLGCGLGAFHLLPAYALQAHTAVNNLEFGAGVLLTPASVASGAGKLRNLALLVPLAGAVALWASTRARPSRPALAVWITLGVTTMLVTPLALPLWAGLAPLHRVQFPWRLVGPVSLLCAAAIALAWPRAPRPARWAAGAVAAVLGAVAVAASLAAHPHGPSPVAETRAATDWPYAQAPEYLPPPPGDAPWKSALGAGRSWEAEAAVESSPCLGRHPLTVRSGSALLAPAQTCTGTVRLPVFGFPGWEARADGRPANVGRDAATGLLVVEGLTHPQRLELRRVQLPVERMAAAVSVLAAAVWLLAAVMVLRRRSAAR